MQWQNQSAFVGDNAQITNVLFGSCFRRWKGIRGVECRALEFWTGWLKNKRWGLSEPPPQFLHRGGLRGMLTLSPCDFSSMHVPQHFTGIWALGKLKRPAKSLITLELPIGYDCYRGFQNFSKEATEWHLRSLGSLVVIKPWIRSFMEESSGLICFTPLRYISWCWDTTR